MGLKTIYISNVLESYYRGYDQLSEAEKKYWYDYDFREANRTLFYGNDNKVIVTSYPINPKHTAAVCKVMGWENVLILYPEHPSVAISLDLTREGGLKAKLVEIIRQNPGINLIQYRSTPEFHELIRELKREKLDFKTPELIDSKDEFIVNYYNTKRGFRHLWSGTLGLERRDINIPFGFITGNVEEAIEAAWWFRNHNRSFVIKYNRGVQGMGVIMNQHEDFSNLEKEFKSQLKLKLKETIWREPAVVVEEYIDPDTKTLGGSPNVELIIDDTGKVIFSYPCEQILEEGKKFIGVYIHPELMKYPQMKAAKQAGEKFGEALSKLGYRGCYDLDMVIGKDGKAFAVEANLRRTGGTHAHEAASSLLGPNYWQNNHVLVLDLKLSQKLNYETYFEMLADLKWNEARKEGIILVNDGLLEVKLLVPIIIAKSHKRVEELKAKLKNQFREYLT